MRLHFLHWWLRFLRPNSLRFEDQIEAFPYSFQGIELARYPRVSISSCPHGFDLASQVFARPALEYKGSGLRYLVVDFC